MSKLISIEGIDGAGKTSLVNKLGELGYTVYHEIPKTIDGLTTEEIQNSEDSLGMAIRTMLQSKVEDNDKYRNYMSLMFTRLRQGYQTKLASLLEENNVIIDRGILSTLVYGHTNNEDNNKALAEANLKTKTPDVTIYLKIDVETSMKRLGMRDEKPEAYKTIETVAKNLFLFDQEISKHKDSLNIITVDATQDKEAVLNQVLAIIS